jgi:hypothetical protein
MKPLEIAGEALGSQPMQKQIRSIGIPFDRGEKHSIVPHQRAGPGKAARNRILSVFENPTRTDVSLDMLSRFSHATESNYQRWTS